MAWIEGACDLFALKNRSGMEEIEKRVVAMFPPGVELLDIYRNYNDEEYIKILNSVDDFHWFSGKPYHYSWLAFLYSGCLNFNR